MQNLLNETLEILEENGKTPADVLWVGGGQYAATWDEFAVLADADYYNGYGGTEVPVDLYVVGDDWWLERHEYDGSEWWEFKTMPHRHANPEPLLYVIDARDATLIEIHLARQREQKD